MANEQQTHFASKAARKVAVLQIHAQSSHETADRDLLRLMKHEIVEAGTLIDCLNG